MTSKPMPVSGPPGSLADSVRKCLHLIGRERRRRWLLLIVLALAVSGFEAAGALLVLLMLGLVTAPDERLVLPAVGDVRTWLPGLEQDELLLLAAVFIAAFFLVRAAVVLAQAYLQHRVANNAGARLSTRLLHGYLSMPYEFHLRRNSAELIRNAYDTVQVVVREVFAPSARMLSDSFVVVGMLAVLLVTAPAATVMAAAVLGPMIYVLLRVVHPWLKGLGRISQRMSKQSLQSLQQSLQGVREIKLVGREGYFRKEFSDRRRAYARAQGLRATAREIPHTTLETALILFILAFLAVSVMAGRSAVGGLAVLGLFAYAALRMQPALNKIVSGLNALKFAAPAIDQLWDDLVLADHAIEQSRTAKAVPPLRFEQEIRVEHLGFRYAGTTTDVLRDINLTIRWGESIGIVGPTGGGKSTLVDVLVGLLEPTTGTVRVDGVDISEHPPAWQRNIGVVPQSVFLLDDTLRRNIALGERDADIDEARLREALRMAQLEHFIASLPEGLETMVGERGVRLSGGQRQRVAIARALYRGPSVLVFDEGTSSLDNVTEAELIRALDRLRGKRTVITVAHRLTTVRGCDRIILVRDGRIVDEAPFELLVAHNPEFRRMVAETAGTSP
jgi:ATP-binding cassette, subfamily B, bacterial PglK